MALKLKTAPAVQAISLADVKTYLRIGDSDDDTLLNRLIDAAVRNVEEYITRAMIQQTWTLWLDRFPAKERRDAPTEGLYQLPVGFFDVARRTIELPRPPLISVNFLKTYDTASTAATFDASRYYVDSASEPGRIALNSGETWPAGPFREVNAVEIEFVAGYGAADTDILAIHREALAETVKYFYSLKTRQFEGGESRLLLEINSKAELPENVRQMLNPFRIQRL